MERFHCSTAYVIDVYFSFIHHTDIHRLTRQHLNKFGEFERCDDYHANKLATAVADDVAMAARYLNVVVVVVVAVSINIA